MEQYLNSWLQSLKDPSLPRGSSFWTLTTTITVSRYTLVFSAVFFLVLTMNALSAHTIKEALVYVRMMLGVYAGMAVMVTMRRKELLMDSLRTIARVAARTEKVMARYPVLQVRMQTRLRQAKRQVTFYIVYGFFVFVGTMITMVIETQRWGDAAASWLTAEAAGQPQSRTAVVWAHRVTLFIELAGAYPVIISLLAFMLPCLLVVYGFLAHIQSQINYFIEVNACTAEWARMHSELMQAAVAFNRVVERYVIHYLVAAFILPLFATVDVVMNGRDADGFALTLFPVIFIVFVPMCEVGEEMSEAHADLAQSAYRGPWLEERSDQAVLRSCLMVASKSRGALFRGRGIGVLDRRTCRMFMRGWFNFLQALINLRRGRTI